MVGAARAGDVVIDADGATLTGARAAWPLLGWSARRAREGERIARTAWARPRRLLPGALPISLFACAAAEIPVVPINYGGLQRRTPEIHDLLAAG